MTEFKFTAPNQKKAEQIIAKYPQGRQASAVLPLLDLAQRQNKGHVNREIINHVADMLRMPAMRVFEVSTFYSMYNHQPVGEHQVNVCTTTPCWLRGSDEIVKACEKKLKISCGETTKDQKFTLKEVECLGACSNAPLVQINDDYYEDLDASTITDILGKLAKGEKPKPGSQIGRKGAEPTKGMK